MISALVVIDVNDDSMMSFSLDAGTFQVRSLALCMLAISAGCWHEERTPAPVSWRGAGHISQPQREARGQKMPPKTLLSKDMAPCRIRASRALREAECRKKRRRSLRATRALQPERAARMEDGRRSEAGSKLMRAAARLRLASQAVSVALDTLAAPRAGVEKWERTRRHLVEWLRARHGLWARLGDALLEGSISSRISPRRMHSRAPRLAASLSARQTP
ncbi:hypothetical protein PSPO01_07659 [Paraphaeosphaeria sporulosa]